MKSISVNCLHWKFQCLLFFLWSAFELSAFSQLRTHMDKRVALMGGQHYYTIYNPRFSVFLIYPWDLKFNHFLQTNADGDTTTTSAAAAPAVGFPHSDVHFPIKKEFGEFFK